MEKLLAEIAELDLEQTRTLLEGIATQLRSGAEHYATERDAAIAAHYTLAAEGVQQACGELNCIV